MSWTERVVAEMVAAKGRGDGFGVAWARALRVHQPRSMDLGPAVRELGDECSLVEFVEERCRVEWLGEDRMDYAAGLMLLGETGGVARSGKSQRIAA